jgi:hypothetical protein
MTIIIYGCAYCHAQPWSKLIKVISHLLLLSIIIVMFLCKRGLCCKLEMDVIVKKSDFGSSDLYPLRR